MLRETDRLRLRPLALEDANRRAELGYWIGRYWWGQGYTTETATCLLRFGFEQLGLHRIYANHNEGNTASTRVLQKLGMKQEGTLREHAWIRGRFVDLIYYGILQSEYLAQQEGRPTK